MTKLDDLKMTMVRAAKVYSDAKAKKSIPETQLNKAKGDYMNAYAAWEKENKKKPATKTKSKSKKVTVKTKVKAYTRIVTRNRKK